MKKRSNLSFQDLEQIFTFLKESGFMKNGRLQKTINWDSERYDGIRSHRKEFGKVAQVAANIRMAFSEITNLFPDSTMYRRLSSKLFEALKADTTHERGMRTVEAGNVTVLDDFQFNQQAKFYRTCNAKYKVTLDRSLGQAAVAFPAFTPLNEIRAPKNATHFKMVASIHAINFDNHQTETTCMVTNTLPLDAPMVEAFVLPLTFLADDPRHLFVSVGIAFVEIENGRAYSVKGNRLNAMAIAEVFPKPAKLSALPSANKKAAKDAVPPTVPKNKGMRATMQEPSKPKRVASATPKKVPVKPTAAVTVSALDMLHQSNIPIPQNGNSKGKRKQPVINASKEINHFMPPPNKKANTHPLT
ncbi:hypothetical protein LX64_03406 [Chitinophaga skermanii]|uniref:Uncharacterized protein n=1 Tax=Chitinophaga skermanii TaxID=331697 RepID=A0A327QGF0_9BACT|nr:hypothetical protein [Chitinophaga skermanii]RAJ02393.1 hypothetical protein LX64_03406 [Chitinophaga skermanii]